MQQIAAARSRYKLGRRWVYGSTRMASLPSIAALPLEVGGPELHDEIQVTIPVDVFERPDVAVLTLLPRWRLQAKGSTDRARSPPIVIQYLAIPTRLRSPANFEGSFAP